MDTNLETVATQFVSQVMAIEPLGNGLINDTYQVQADTGRFVLQRINHQVFHQPEQIMANLIALNQHLRQKDSKISKLKIPEVLLCRNGALFYQDSKQDYWRALSYIENTESHETIRSLHDAGQVGFALGHFHYLVKDLDPSTLADTLPGFHIAPDYWANYQRVLQKTTVKPDKFCAGFIQAHHGFCNDLEQAKQKGQLTLRVMHGDPKLNNFLFDKTSQQVASLIDLDTVKPGLVHYDIGDCLRSCCHLLDSHQFDLDIAEGILTAYLSEVAGFFTAADYSYIYPAARLIPFELGLRFYTDYLDGNWYFKVTDPLQNLERAIGQFQLCADVLQHEGVFARLVEACMPRYTKIKKNHLVSINKF